MLGERDSELAVVIEEEKKINGYLNNKIVEKSPSIR